MDNFDAATSRARRCARNLLADGVPPVIAADAMIAQGLAVWAAATGRHYDAGALIVAWTLVRDS